MTNTRIADEMATLAASISDSDERMDYSVQSLTVLDAELPGTERREAIAASLGEVIRRNSRVEVLWQWPPPKSIYPDLPQLQVAGQHYLCPDQRVGPSWKSASNDSLVDYANQAITLAASPTKETAERLGLKPSYRFPTAWDGIRDAWVRKQRRRVGHVPS